jgi:hypothetical protein
VQQVHLDQVEGVREALLLEHGRGGRAIRREERKRRRILQLEAVLEDELRAATRRARAGPTRIDGTSARGRLAGRGHGVSARRTLGTSSMLTGCAPGRGISSPRAVVGCLRLCANTSYGSPIVLR